MERIGLLGDWEIHSKNVLTGEEKTYEYHNMIIQGFYDILHGFLNYDIDSSPTADDFKLNYVALGDNSTAVQRSNTSLGNEVERYVYTVKSYTDMAYTIRLFLGTSQGNMTEGYIKELGVVANGTSTLESGTLISRSVVNIRKNDNIQLTLTWTFKGVAA